MYKRSKVVFFFSLVKFEDHVATLEVIFFYFRKDAATK